MDIGEKRLLVRDVDNRILAENDIEALRGKWQWTRGCFDQPIAYLRREALPDGAARSQREVLSLNINAQYPGSAEALDQQQVDTADSAADIQDLRAADVTAGQGGRDFLRAAGR